MRSKSDVNMKAQDERNTECQQVKNQGKQQG